MSHECHEENEFASIWTAIDAVREKQSEHDKQIAVLDTQCKNIKDTIFDVIKDLKIRIDTLFGDRKKIAFAIIGSLSMFVFSLIAYIWKGSHG